MGGLAILIIVLLYIGAAVWIALRIKRWWRKALVVAVAILLPTADGYLGRQYVKHLCALDGGLKVFRVVEKVDGVMGLAPDKGTLERTGYQFIEIDRAASDPGRAYRRIERRPDGEIVERFDGKPRARFKVGYRPSAGNPAGNIYGVQDWYVESIDGAEVLARYRMYSGGVGWAERLLGQFSDAGYAVGIECPPRSTQLTYEQLARAVLHP